MRWMLHVFVSAITVFYAPVVISDDDCTTSEMDVCKMASFIADIMDQDPSFDDGLSVTASGRKVSYSVITAMSMQEANTSASIMQAWASDVQSVMCATPMIHSFVKNGGEIWYGIKGKDFERSLLELRCRNK